MKYTDIIDGAIYWTTVPSMESEGYGDVAPREPHRVKAFIEKNGTICVYCFNSETGEIDDDTNAKAFIYPNNVPEKLFELKEQADLHYNIQCAERAIELLREALLYAKQCLLRGRYATVAYFVEHAINFIVTRTDGK